MPSQLVPRRRTPVILVAYGEPGMMWLRTIRRRCMANPAVLELVERSVIQFWCIGDAPSKVEGVHHWTEAPALAVVSDALESARSARAMAECPGLSVRELLVLERISLFSRGVAQMRENFWNSIEAVPEYVQRDSDGRPGFQYRRIAFADSLHDPARVTDDARTEARRAALAVGPELRTFLVDRQDTNVAVVDEDLAERCLAELAMVFVAGDIGAPRNDGVSVVLPDMIVRHDDSPVIPFGVAVVEHAWADIAAARVSALVQALASGTSDYSRAELALGSPSMLLDEFNADVAALESSRFDRHLRRVARERAAQAAIGWALVTGETRMIRDVIADVKREIARLRGHAIHVDASKLTPNPAATSVALSVIVPWQSFASRAEVLVVIVALLALSGVAIVWVRRKRADAIPSGVIQKDVLPTGIRRDVTTEWEQLCERLSGFLEYWEKESRRLRSTQEGAAIGRSRWKSNPPIAWRLTNPDKIEGDDVVITPELCLELGRRITGEWYDDKTYPEMLQSACQQEISRWDAQRNTGRSLLGEYLKGSMSTERSRELRAFVESRPYLTNATPPPVRDAILWFSAPELAVGEQLCGIESAAVRESATAMSHDDNTRSVRFNFAHPVMWSVISSLAFPKADAS